MSIRLFAPALLVVGMLSFSGCEVKQTEPGRAPSVDVDPGKVPKVDIDAPSVDVGTTPKDVNVPDVDVDVKTEKRTINVPDVNVTPANEDANDQ